MATLTEMRALTEGVITVDQLNESTKSEKYKLYGSNEAKALNLKLKAARSEKDEKKKKALYKEALPMAKALKAKASKIPDNDFGDWFIDLVIKPWWWFLADALTATAYRGDNIKAMSRSQAVGHFNDLISEIEKNAK